MKKISEAELVKALITFELQVFTCRAAVKRIVVEAAIGLKHEHLDEMQIIIDAMATMTKTLSVFKQLYPSPPEPVLERASRGLQELSGRLQEFFDDYVLSASIIIDGTEMEA